VGAVEDLSNVICCHEAVALFVNLVPGLVDPRLACCVGLSSDCLEESIEVDEAVLFGVEVVKEELCLTLGNLDTVVTEAKEELLFVQLAHTVMNHDVLEGLGDASQGTDTSCFETSLNLGQDCYHKA